MSQDYNSLFEILYRRNNAQLDAASSRFAAAGLKTPEHFGGHGDTPPPSPQPAARLQAKAALLDDVLQVVEVDYDKLIAKIEGKVAARARIKLFAAVISAISSCGLLALLSTTAEREKYIAAGVALLASLATVFQDFVGVKSSQIWDGLLKASASREEISKIRLKIKIAMINSDESDLDRLVEPTSSAEALLKRLIRDLHLGELSAGN